MAVPGFRAEALNEDGGPLWIDSVAAEDPNHLLHVVRGLDPAAAIELVGGRVVRELAPGQLPAERPDSWSTPVHTAVGADRMVDLLLAGRRGEWTFVYDTSGVTGWAQDRREMSAVLSADGRVAAVSIWTINADSSFSYAVDGEAVFTVTESYNPFYDAETPDVLRPVIEAAGRPDGADDDYEINMRLVCALAGLTWTPAELRAEPLLVGTVEESAFYDLMAKMREVKPASPEVLRDLRAEEGSA
jgi:hypothetical protein